MILVIMKILLHNEYKIINLWYPTYVYQFFNFLYNYKNRVLACFQTRPVPLISPLAFDFFGALTIAIIKLENIIEYDCKLCVF